MLNWIKWIKNLFFRQHKYLQLNLVRTLYPNREALVIGETETDYLVRLPIFIYNEVSPYYEDKRFAKDDPQIVGVKVR